MLDALKKWVSGPSPEQRGRDVVQQWTRDQGSTADIDATTGRLAASMPGGDVDGGRPWSLEWGPSQRSYLTGSELCLRCELPVPMALQVLVLDCALRARLEREVFESYVQDLHTRVDTRTPPEMRWLVMLPPVPSEAALALGDTFSAVASDPAWASRWLTGEVPQRLAVSRRSAEADTPLVLMLSRGRLTLRTGLESPEPAALDRLSGVLRSAAAAAVAATAD